MEITDLLGRAQVKVNNDEILAAIRGKTVLVTGGGGSIGSELCRQIAKSEPKKLVIFDIYENNAYEIQQELIRKYGDKLNLDVRIGSVRNTNRIRWIMDTYRPDIVFHAAAHKHVPLMEDSPNEAIKNNVIGTYKTAKAAAKAGVTGCTVDGAARQLITDAGYGAYFGHGFGHGVGLFIHESPTASSRSDKPLPAGAVLTAEPGIYLPGQFGVRIEDMLYLTQDGNQNLTLSPKDLIVL